MRTAMERNRGTTYVSISGSKDLAHAEGPTTEHSRIRGSISSPSRPGGAQMPPHFTITIPSTRNTTNTSTASAQLSTSALSNPSSLGTNSSSTKTTQSSPSASSPSTASQPMANYTLTSSLSSEADERRGKRKRKTPEQLLVLEGAFQENCLPTKEARDRISLQLGLSPRQVQIWFQNKRAKMKNKRNEAKFLETAAAAATPPTNRNASAAAAGDTDSSLKRSAKQSVQRSSRSQPTVAMATGSADAPHGGANALKSVGIQTVEVLLSNSIHPSLPATAVSTFAPPPFSFHGTAAFAYPHAHPHQCHVAPFGFAVAPSFFGNRPFDTGATALSTPTVPPPHEEPIQDRPAAGAGSPPDPMVVVSPLASPSAAMCTGGSPVGDCGVDSEPPYLSSDSFGLSPSSPLSAAIGDVAAGGDVLSTYELTLPYSTLPNPVVSGGFVGVPGSPSTDAFFQEIFDMNENGSGGGPTPAVQTSTTSTPAGKGFGIVDTVSDMLLAANGVLAFAATASPLVDAAAASPAVNAAAEPTGSDGGNTPPSAGMPTSGNDGHDLMALWLVPDLAV